jgi:hypothetical protein
LAALLTWPTVTHLTTHLPGDGGDDPALAWNLWWVKYALLNEGRDPLYSDFIFYPLGVNLAFYTLTLLNALTALPLTLNWGVVAASNLHMLFTFVAGGYGAFLLTRTALAEMDAALPPRVAWRSAAIAGGFYAFAGSKLFYVALGQFNIASSHWIPFALLYLIRVRRRPARLKNALLAGLFFSLQAWAEMTYASFILVFALLYWLHELLPPHPNPLPLGEGTGSGLPSPFGRGAGGEGFFNTTRALLALGLTCAVGLAPLLAHMLPDLWAEGDFLVEGSGFAGSFSADLVGFWIPTMHHPWLGHLIATTGAPYDKGQHIYIGFVLTGLALVAARRPVARFWLLAAFIFGLLCLGPTITVSGHETGLWGPFSLFQSLPLFKGNRYPSRYSVMLILCLSVTAAYGLSQLSRRRFNLLAALLALAFLCEHLSLPLPQSDMRVPPAYAIIAATPGDFAVLDIPFAWRNGFRITGALTTQFMFGQFYQSFHQKRLLQGNTSRNPAFKFQYFTTTPVIPSLLALETGHTATQWETDRAVAAETLRFFDIRYIVVRPFTHPRPDGTTVSEQAVIPYIEAILPVAKIYDAQQMKIYRVLPSAPPRQITLDAATPLYFGEGWGLLTPGRPIAAQRREARLLLPRTAGRQRITLRLRRPEAGPPRTITLAADGWQSAPQPLGPEWHTLTFELPPQITDLRLQFSATTPMPPGGTDLTVLSAGEETGDFGHIYQNGHEISLNQRGYNIALIEPETGAARVANFDTHLDPTASPALADFIAGAPSGTFVAAAAADEAGAALGPEAIAALRAAGAQVDLRGCFRCSHAFIGGTSAGPLEASDSFAPVGVTTGLGLTEPNVAALVAWIQVEAVREE